MRKQNIGNNEYYIFGKRISTLDLTNYLSTIKVRTKEGKTYSLLYNGSLSSLRKDDDVRLKVYSFDEKKYISQKKYSINITVV